MPTLDWIGKQAVINYHKKVPFRLLESNEQLSIGNPNSDNILVQGDNLEVLKALLPYYAGQVKCIYIDPPYNTGNEEWVYNDNVNSPEIKDWLGKVVGDETSDLSRHDKWLCMMYPRLQILKEFLRDDGVIIISIDDFEVFHLRCIMNEIFGPNNFIAQLIWDKTRKNDAKLFSVGHEYLMIYARSLSVLRKLKTVWRESKPGAKEIMDKFYKLKKIYGEDHAAIEAELREWYKELPKGHPSKKLSRYKHVDENGIWRDRDISWPGGGGPRYDVIHPVTGKACKVPERGWGFATSAVMEDQIKKGLVVFREDHTKPPFRKAYLATINEESSMETEEIKNDQNNIGLQVMPSVIYKQAQVAVKLLRNIFNGKKVFPNPKDHEVLMRLIKYITKPGDIILDAFAGSASTAHAVLQLNNEELSEKKRKFILIEMDEHIFQNVAVKRIRKLINGYSYINSNGKEERVSGLGGGAKVCQLGKTLFDKNGLIRKQINYKELARFIYFLETGKPLLISSLDAPLLGVDNDIAIYLLYNGILGDKTPQSGNVLTRAVLSELPTHNGPKIIYGTSCRLSTERLKRENITFKEIVREAARYMERVQNYTTQQGTIAITPTDVEVAKLDAGTARDGVIKLVHNLYSGARTLEETYVAAERGLAIAEETLRITRIKYEAGLATRAEVLKAEADLAAAEQKLFDLTAQHTYMKMALEKPWAYMVPGTPYGTP